MIDRDLAELYGVETRVLKQAVRRNLERFPEDFMFEMSKEEFESWRSDNVTSPGDKKGLRVLKKKFDRALQVSLYKPDHMLSCNEHRAKMFSSKILTSPPPDIGRFFNVDPLSEKYYYNSPYAFSENKVVAHVELEGLEAAESNEPEVMRRQIGNMIDRGYKGLSSRFTTIWNSLVGGAEQIGEFWNIPGVSVPDVPKIQTIVYSNEESSSSADAPNADPEAITLTLDVEIMTVFPIFWKQKLSPGAPQKNKEGNSGRRTIPDVAKDQMAEGDVDAVGTFSEEQNNSGEIWYDSCEDCRSVSLPGTPLLQPKYRPKHKSIVRLRKSIKK